MGNNTPFRPQLLSKKRKLLHEINERVFQIVTENPKIDKHKYFKEIQYKLHELDLLIYEEENQNE